MKRRPQKRISNAWGPEIRRKVTVFDKNATKSDFERAPSDISAIPTHLDGSQGSVRGQKIQKNENARVCQTGLSTWDGAWPSLLPVTWDTARWKGEAPAATEQPRVTSPKGAKTCILLYFFEYLAGSAAKCCKGRVGIA